jgi:phage-related minor tail protein
MLDLKESMLDVYSSGFAANMEEAAQTMSLVKRVTGETGDALTETTNDALAFSKAFGADVTETIRATDAVMTGFGVSGEKAMDLMAYAIQRTGDPAGDLLGTFTEYGPLMEQIGLSAEQFTAGLIGGLEQGAFDSDKLGDAMKEFGISLMDDVSEVGPRMTEALAAGGRRRGAGLDRYTGRDSSG